MPNPAAEREIAVDYLARVEGEGSMYLKLDGNEVVDLKFKIFEPPRFFEAFLVGRSFEEVPDITARICGICPVAYQTSSVNAIEAAAGVDVGDGIRQIRRLLYCGEWIESHALHVFLLHAPDFLGYDDGIAMAADHPDIVTEGLRIKQIGNRLVSVVGGREIHPINVKVGGYYRAPTRPELTALVPDLEWAADACERSIAWVAAFEFPDLEEEYEFVALTHPDEYAIDRGRIISSKGVDISVDQWPEVFEEEHVEWSNALHARVKARGSYHVGPMARYALNRDQLHPRAATAAEAAGLGPVCINPFKSIIVRLVETLHALEEALQVIDAYAEPSPAAVPVDPRGGTGHGASEAPRGLLYHRYEIDGDGLVAKANIVPPTSQNQLSIEEDLRRFVKAHADLDDDRLRWMLEQAIRNYDPCISCATHFLDLRVERTSG